jgi:hypothetical protein
MPRYPTTWVDYRLPTGQEFAVGVCGYTGRVRHMIVGTDPIRRMFIRYVNVEGKNCDAAQHCLDMSCPLNKTSREHLTHMLDMPEDEQMDTETSKLWGTESTVEGLVKFAEKMNEALPEELRKSIRAEECPPGGE